MEFQVNDFNKAIWDKNFIKFEGNDDVQECVDGVWQKAQPLNNDPDIQEYGAVTDLLKHGYLNKDYKIFDINSQLTQCYITKEPLKIYDVVLLIDGWEISNGFAVFLGTDDNDKELYFKYYHGSDTIRNYKPKIK